MELQIKRKKSEKLKIQKLKKVESPGKFVYQQTILKEELEGIMEVLNIVKFLIQRKDTRGKDPRHIFSDVYE